MFLNSQVKRNRVATRSERYAAPNLIMHTALLSLAALTATACTGDSSNSFTRLEDAPRYTLHEERRIGSGTDPNLGFTLISGVARDSQGLVYAFDARESELRVFNEDGHLVRKIGRRGQGPGEFTSTPTFGITGDTIWTFQSEGVGARKLTLFNLLGEVISSSELTGVRVTLHGERRAGIVLPTRMYDGLLHGRLTIWTGTRPGDPPAPAPNDTVRVPRVRWNLAGEIVDTVGWYEEPPVAESNAPSSVRPGGRFVMVPRPPSAEAIFVTLADGVVVVDNRAPADASTASTTLTRLNYKGDTVFSRSYGYEAYPYDEATLAGLAWEYAKTGGGIPIIDGVPTPPPMPADSMNAYTALRAAMQFPAYQPPFGQQRIGDDGSVWLARYKADGSNEWIIFDREGALMGQLTLPSGTRVLRINGRDIWASVPDDVDVQWLVRYSLQRVDTER